VIPLLAVLGAGLGILSVDTHGRRSDGETTVWAHPFPTDDTAIPDDAFLRDQLEKAVDLRRREDYDRMLDARDPGELVEHATLSEAALDRRTLGKFKIHPISFFQPEEDENILFHIWDSYWVSFLFPFMDELPNYQHFDEALSPEHKSRIMAFYKSMLQRHMYATGKKYYVAKAPAFSAKIETLTEFFPDARIIYLARNPLDMLPSTISWINYARGVFTQPKEKYLYLDEIRDFTQHWYYHPLKYLDSHPSPRHLILKYDDLIQRPEQTLRAFYEQFGYPDKPGLVDIVDQAVKETLAFHSDHVYSYEEMGFTRQQIIDLYSDIFERFEFDERDPARSDLEP